MIYLDSAATSLQKPREVETAMITAMRTKASPGRGGHRPAMLAADAALDCRIAVADLFNAGEPERVVFTLNATHALNIAIRSVVKPGARVVISGYEHNSVTRPLNALGAEVTVAASPLFEPEAAVEAFRKALPGADACVCNHVSNVFGYILPLEEIAEMCAANGVPLIVDASQSAGCADIDFKALRAEFMAMPGHKGLLGPQGTGILLCRDGGEPLMYGGTGSDSALQSMPAYLPDRLEAGTHNITGIAGLLEGVKFVTRRTPAKILAHERRLSEILSARLRRIPGLAVYDTNCIECKAGVLSVGCGGLGCVNLAEALGKRGVAIRAGLHCAPTAHRTAGTFESGTARFSFSPFNTESEVRRAAEITSAAVSSGLAR